MSSGLVRYQQIWDQKRKEGLALLSRAKVRRLLRIAVVCSFVFLLFWIIMKLALYILPFLIAFVIANTLEPVIRFFMNRFKMSRKVSSITVLSILLVSLGSMTILLASRIFRELKQISVQLPHYLQEIYLDLKNITDTTRQDFPELSDALSQSLDVAFSRLAGYVGSKSDLLMQSLVDLAISIPGMLLFIIVTLLSTYFFSADRNRIADFLQHLLPASFSSRAEKVKHGMLAALSLSL
ncbi:MAG: AI-2E family transporter, partial [Clostridia bacterium]|nr:AI-2E family transporter [Clostridia bacterium]